MTSGGISPLPLLSSFGSDESRKRRASDRVNYNDHISDADFERLLREQERSRNQRQRLDPSMVRG